MTTGELGGSCSGVLNVAAVPLPASALLLVSALVALGFLRRWNSLA